MKNKKEIWALASRLKVEAERLVVYASESNEDVDLYLEEIESYIEEIRELLNEK
jgi:hypothetical protein